jgi:nitrile hydratase beta subunit-like protein
MRRRSASVEQLAGKARFKPGDRVRVRVDDPPRHIRTPAYIQGKTGWIEAINGVFRNPESRAHGGSGLPKQFLYRVAFDLSHVWGRAAAPPQDKLLIDLYEHWLESA